MPPGLASVCVCALEILNALNAITACTMKPFIAPLCIRQLLLASHCMPIETTRPLVLVMLGLDTCRFIAPKEAIAAHLHHLATSRPGLMQTLILTEPISKVQPN